MGFDKPDLGFVVHLGAPVVAGGVLPADRPRRAARSSGPRWCCCPATEDRDIWAYFASLAFPPEPLVRRTLDVLSERAAVDGGDRDPGRPVAHAPGDAAEGSRRRRRRAAGQGRLGRRPGAEWMYDEERHRRIATARAGRAAGHAGLPRHAGVPPRVPARASSTTTPGSPADAATPARARCGSRRVDAAAEAAAQERITRPGVPVPPRKQWPSGMAELAVPASGPHRRGRAGGRGPGDRAALGHRLGHAGCVSWSSGDDVAGAAGGARRLRAGARRLDVGGAAGRRGRGRARAPGRTSSPTWPGGSPRSGGCRCWAPLEPRRRPARAAAQLRAAARGGVGARWASPEFAVRRPGPAGRRRDRHRMDDHGRRPPPAPGGCTRRAAVRPGPAG